MASTKVINLFALVTLYFLVESTWAEENDVGGTDQGTPSVEELAVALTDPNTSLDTMNFFFDAVGYQGRLDGADSASSYALAFQPSLPYALSDTTNLFIRPLVPISLSRDVPADGTVESVGFGLGDMSFDAAIFKSYPGGWVLGGGLAGTLPTATEDELGLDQWLIGPEILVARMRDWGVVGLLFSHQIDIAGEDDFDTRITGGQYFYSFNLPKGWTFGAGPTFSYNHEASSGDRWTLPVGVGATRTTILGGTAWRFGIQLWSYLEQPDPFGPDWQLRVQVSPVVPLPW